MKCPLCLYVDGWYWEGDDHVKVEGTEGSFFSMDTKVSRQELIGEGEFLQVKQLYGCPSCRVTFIDD